jgi:hypothetical protein
VPPLVDFQLVVCAIANDALYPHDIIQIRDTEDCDDVLLNEQHDCALPGGFGSLNISPPRSWWTNEY